MPEGTSPLAWQLVGAVLLDLLLGDPRWLPHPVRGMGWLAQWGERWTRVLIPWPFLAGMTAVVLVVATSATIAWAVLAAADTAHPLVGYVAGTWMIYTSVAARDLARHGKEVYDALKAGDLPQARQRVGYMVGRDTEGLDEREVVRATVESVAESIVDGVTAPLFWAALLGPIGALAYRAVNTLDSMFGYRDERYEKFGWVAARLDDVVNFIPARLTGPLICLAAGLLGMRGRNAWRVLQRDGGKHPSPNAGRTEAAVAGALGVRLGGVNYYAGEASIKPHLGNGEEPLAAAHILDANRLMFVTAGLFLTGCMAAVIFW